jgi:hypothetical protein
MKKIKDTVIHVHAKFQIEQKVVQEEFFWFMQRFIRSSGPASTHVDICLFFPSPCICSIGNISRT